MDKSPLATDKPSTEMPWAPSINNVVIKLVINGPLPSRARLE